MLHAVKVNVVKLHVVILNVILLSVILLNDMAPHVKNDTTLTLFSFFEIFFIQKKLKGGVNGKVKR